MGHKQSGFSIVELMVVLVVAGIILAFGVPSFNSQIKSSRLTGAANEFVAAMHLSRSEASKRSTPVVICASDSAVSGTSESCSQTDWNRGWIVFADNNRNGTLEAGGTDDDGNPIGTDDTIIQRQGEVTSNVFIQSGSDSEITETITYLPNGFADLPLSAQSDRFLVFCHYTANAEGEAIETTGDDRFSRVLAVSSSGRPRILSQDRNETGAPSCE